MSEDIVYVKTSDEHIEPTTWKPTNGMAKRAYQLHNELLRLGKQAQRNRTMLEETWREQGRILKEFWEDPDLCRAFGCEGGWAEYMGQDDFEEIFGAIKEILGIETFSIPQRSRISRLLIHSFLSGENLLKPGKFTRYAEALPDLDAKKKHIEAADTNEKKVAAFQEYQEAVQEYGAMSSRQVRQLVTTHRPPVCAIKENAAPIELFDTDSGEMVLRTNLTPAGSRIADCLSGGRQTPLYWNEEGIYARFGAETKLVARWARPFGEYYLYQLIEKIPNCQRLEG